MPSEIWIMSHDRVADVFIVDDDPSVQRALRRLLTTNGLSGRIFCSAKEFLDQGAPVPAVGCLVLDVQMPGLSGLDLQAELEQRGLSLPIIFITGHGTVPMSVQAMKQGAVDFLQKPFDSQTLIAAIRKAIARSRQQAAKEHECRGLEQRFASLSLREREVFRLVVKGLLNKQIACELGIVEQTVKVHRARLMAKMQADSLAELVRMAEALRLPPCSSSILSPRK
jgi:RNA polymerase sigma factor (sigma-70 family)